MPDADDVWDDELPPGGQVCGACGQPTESEPCADHQPRAVARYEAKALRMDLEALRVTLPVIAGEYTTRVSVSMLRRMYNALTFLDPLDAMDADRPAGDQPDTLRAMVTPREDAEAGTGQTHRPEGSIASSITLDNQSLLDRAHHRACIDHRHPPHAPCVGYAGAWNAHVLEPDAEVERLDRPGNRADGRRV